jgi:hypothetical protein
MCHLQELYAKYKDKGLVVLGLDPADDKKIASELLRENGVTFPNIIDSSEAARKASERDYPLGAWPTSYIIDRDGKVVDAWLGYDKGEPRAIAAIEKTGGPLAEAIRQDMAAKAAKSAPEVAAAAQRLFEVLRTADYDHEGISTRDCKNNPAKEINYNPMRGDRAWVRWVCKKFKANPITDVKLGNVVANSGGAPTVHFELRLKDGEILDGDLPFYFMDWGPAGKQWIGQGGLDWHTRPPTKKNAAKP